MDGRSVGWMDDDLRNIFEDFPSELITYVNMSEILKWNFNRFSSIFFCFFPYKDSVSISSDAFDFPSIVAYSEVVDV